MNTTTSDSASKTAQASIVSTGCCSPFDPAPWQNRTVTWVDEPFVKSHVRTLLHVPLDLGKRVTLGT
jgi:hypothetical protein